MENDYDVSNNTEAILSRPEGPEQVPPRKGGKAQLAIFILLFIFLFVEISACSFYFGTLYQTEVLSEVEAVETENSSGGETGMASVASGTFLIDVSDVVTGAMPSVVSIVSTTIVYTTGSDIGEAVDTVGSGTIIAQNDTELLILTSFDVVEDCVSLYITFNDDTCAFGYVKSYFSEYNIAIAAVPLEDMPTENYSFTPLCTEEVSVGEGVIVIGDALGYGPSVVVGIISAVDREVTFNNKTMSLLQTDAAINEGNSGSCVLNSDGEVVGISIGKTEDSSSEGMYYAVPVYDNYNLIMGLLES